MDIYYQKESIPLTITIVDKNESPIDLDGLDDIEIKVFHKLTEQIMNIFTLSGGTVTKTDAVNGICDVINNGSATNVITGMYITQAKTTETDEDYTPKRYRYGQIKSFILTTSL